MVWQKLSEVLCWVPNQTFLLHVPASQGSFHAKIYGSLENGEYPVSSTTLSYFAALNSPKLAIFEAMIVASFQTHIEPGLAQRRYDLGINKWVSLS